MTTADRALAAELTDAVEEHRGDLADERIVEALQNEADRVRVTEGNRGLEEWV